MVDGGKLASGRPLLAFFAYSSGLNLIVIKIKGEPPKSSSLSTLESPMPVFEEIVAETNPKSL